MENDQGQVERIHRSEVRAWLFLLDNLVAVWDKHWNV